MLDRLTRRLAANAEVFRHLMEDVPGVQVRWKPDSGSWSLLEVINHLADEERDDFRKRVDLTLHRPDEAWPPIDPPRWAQERRYNERDPEESLADFLAERARTLEWLAGLGGVDLDATHEHPTMGALTVGDLLASWLAHDLIHIRQMTRLHYGYAREAASPHSPEYAGKW